MTDDTHSRPRTVTAQYPTFRVVVTRGPDSGQSRELIDGTLSIGSAPDCQFVLTDPGVSSHHCTLEADSAGVRIRSADPGSGVRLGKLRVFEGLVETAAELELGSTLLTVEPMPDVVTREQTIADRFGELLGRSARMRELFAELARVAPTEQIVLIEGERGTGKQLVAESIHDASPRADGPFVAFDTAGLARALAEGELFGHEPAISGTVRPSRPSALERAQRGSLFIDDIAELPHDFIEKLMRVLETGEIPGRSLQRGRALDVRLIAATSRSPSRAGHTELPSELLTRLTSSHLRVPPLRERMQDLPLLVAHFLSRARGSPSLAELPPALWSMFNAYRWPGNVQELWTAVERFVLVPERALARGAESGPDARKGGRSAEAAPLQPLRSARREASDEFERAYLEAVLARTGGNVTRAAAIAEVSRQMVQKLMRKHAIE